MKANPKKAAILLAILVAVTFVSLGIADGIQRDWGKIEITEGVIETDAGNLAYKQYTPAGVTNAPGVLLLHGYQNDHETCAAYAIELARRGVVVLAIDEYGHGASEPGLLSRGYVNHGVKVNFGEDSEANKTYVKVSGPTRYKIMMNFSNLSFFNDYYSKDEDGNAILDSSCGGIAAYAYLASLPCVDDTKLGLSGHSMGTWSSWSVAAAYSGTEIEPKATVLQCGELFRDSVYDTKSIHFNNVLLLQAKWDEFSYFRDYEKTVSDDLLRTVLRLEFLDTSSTNAAWNTTYDSFEKGTARRIELLYTNHRLTTHHKGGLATALDWFDKALDLPTSLAPTDQTAMAKEWLVLAATLLAIGSMLPFSEILLHMKFFGNVRGALPAAKPKTKSAWIRGAVTTILIAAFTYPFMTQLGQGLL
ncbi:MAG: hypothetical protein J6Z38_08410, partial [Lachnospiraceae bacterium]|nr:hypothetical protein [Lachnospiraceae bacterium]